MQKLTARTLATVGWTASKTIATLQKETTEGRPTVAGERVGTPTTVLTTGRTPTGAEYLRKSAKNTS
jgi:hypothetical protein